MVCDTRRELGTAVTASAELQPDMSRVFPAGGSSKLGTSAHPGSIAAQEALDMPGFASLVGRRSAGSATLASAWILPFEFRGLQLLVRDPCFVACVTPGRLPSWWAATAAPSPARGQSVGDILAG